jgi:arsenite-transporting ATPase
MERFTTEHYPKTKFLFFTGKGGVGKTSVASALSYTLSLENKKVLLVSTDPASNLQDIFQQALTNTPILIEGTSHLYALNLDPIQAAEDYKNQMVAPYRGKLPETVIQSMEEQMSGACTVEIAAFNQFSAILTDASVQQDFDVIVFDTAPTGHTLRLLQLPMAWTGFLADNTSGASCLGPLAGLEGQKVMYKKAVEVLADGNQTTLMLVTRPEISPLREAARASIELEAIGIKNQQLLVNGVFEPSDANDLYAKVYKERQQASLLQIPAQLTQYPIYSLPLAPFSITNLERMEKWITDKPLEETVSTEPIRQITTTSLQQMINNYIENPKRVIFTMGKGGVGKTTVAALVALGLANKGKRVHLTTTDPAAHLSWVLGDELPENLTMSNIDPKEVLATYKEEVLSKARETMNENGLSFVQEDLESPCTEEIAVFRAFANVIEAHQDEVVVIDTAPTGHTLLLLDSSESYHKEISRSSGEVPVAVQHLLPTLRNPEETSVIITTLPEATPVYEAERLQQDLQRAGLTVHFWVINQSFSLIQTNDHLLKRKIVSEQKWMERVDSLSNSHTVLIPWSLKEPKGLEGLHYLLQEEQTI